jgi:hypothetical protein
MGTALPSSLQQAQDNCKPGWESLHDFCLAHEGTLLVPAEALGPKGVDPKFGSLLLARQRLVARQLECLSAGYALYWQRCRSLYERAPATWFPPRQTNLLIAADPASVLLYFEPFKGTSSLLYLSDLDTDAEYVAALILHMERLSLVRSVPAAVAMNLSYWFDVDAAARARFAAEARRATRPDAAAFVALADALEWVDELLHDPLRPAPDELAEPYVRVGGADLYVPKRLQPKLASLCIAAEGAVRDAMESRSGVAPVVSERSSAALTELCDWLEETRAHVIVHGPNGGTLWSPEHDDAIRVRRVLADAREEAVRSIHDDLCLVHERSRQFLDNVADVDALPTECAVLETGGGAYVDAARRAVVYEMQQPAFDATAVLAPPFYRLLLGARVMHEWGHIAHTAKILRLPESNRAAYFEARAELGETFARVVDAIPAAFREAVDAELKSIEPVRASLPKALARKTLARVGDYLANLMSARLIPPEEMQAYVRTNVTHHLDENLGLVSELARYAYEIHYLALAGIPRSYFYGTSRFPDHFIASGIVRAEDAEALFDAAGRVLACYGIDETRLRLPAVANRGAVH